MRINAATNANPFPHRIDLNRVGRNLQNGRNLQSPDQAAPAARVSLKDAAAPSRETVAAVKQNASDARAGSHASDAPQPLPSPAPATPSVAGLLEAWGQDDPGYDLDGNGTVEMRDLLQLLARLASGESERTGQNATANPADSETAATLDSPQTVAPASTEIDGAQTAAAEDRPESPAATTPPRVEALLEAWGTSEPRFDFDESGEVGMNDLLEMLARIAQHGPQSPDTQRVDEVASTPDQVEEKPENEPAPVDLSRASRLRKILHAYRGRLADAAPQVRFSRDQARSIRNIARDLRERGVEQISPRRLRSFLEPLDLSPQQQRLAVRHLLHALQFEHGLDAVA